MKVSELEAKKLKIEAELIKAREASPEVLLELELAKVEDDLRLAQQVEEQKEVERASIDILKLEGDIVILREELFTQASGMIQKCDDMLSRYYRMKMIVDDHPEQLSLHKSNNSISAISAIARYLFAVVKNYEAAEHLGKN